jgi:predicted site-specific integrase-resolvase
MAENQSLLRVGLYARVSSDAQKEDETIDSQIAVLEERIQRDGQVVAAGVGHEQFSHRLLCFR